MHYHRRKDTSPADKDLFCECGQRLSAGMFFGRRPVRSLATCYHEAAHAGTQYPIRKWVSVCESCMTEDERKLLAEVKSRRTVAAYEMNGATTKERERWTTKRKK